jgi:D-3-phosphoglycerate dehydrogenase
MNVTILDDYQDAVRTLACFAKLAGHRVTVFNDTVKGEDAIVARLAGAEAVVLIRERTRLSASILERLPALRLISQTARAGGHIDEAACTRLGIAIAQGAGSPVAPAELTWALVLAASRHVPLEAARLRAGRWQTTIGRALHGRTLGVYGYGRIGALVARYGRAFGMRVIAWGREGSAARARADGVDLAASREALFAEADVLSIHLRLAPETRGIVSLADLGRMKPDALLVNTSRAELIADGALVRALAAGRPGAAAVDVFESEPVIDGAHPLLALDNVVATPHLGYVERDSYEAYFGAAFDNVVAFAEGRPANIVNAAALGRR